MTWSPDTRKHRAAELKLLGDRMTRYRQLTDRFVGYFKPDSDSARGLVEVRHRLEDLHERAAQRHRRLAKGVVKIGVAGLEKQGKSAFLSAWLQCERSCPRRPSAAPGAPPWSSQAPRALAGHRGVLRQTRVSAAHQQLLRRARAGQRRALGGPQRARARSAQGQLPRPHRARGRRRRPRLATRHRGLPRAARRDRSPSATSRPASGSRSRCCARLPRRAGGDDPALHRPQGHPREQQALRGRARGEARHSADPRPRRHARRGADGPAGHRRAQRQGPPRHRGGPRQRGGRHHLRQGRDAPVARAARARAPAHDAARRPVDLAARTGSSSC
jgi:hypothetical protein